MRTLHKIFTVINGVICYGFGMETAANTPSSNAFTTATAAPVRAGNAPSLNKQETSATFISVDGDVGDDKIRVDEMET